MTISGACAIAGSPAAAIGKQLRQLALDTDTSTQALGEEAVNLLFAQHGINRSA